MNTSLVCERAVSAEREQLIQFEELDLEKRYARNGVHEGDVDLHSFSNQVLDFSEHGQVVLGLDVFRIGGIQASDKATQRGDTNTFTNTEDGYSCWLANEIF